MAPHRPPLHTLSTDMPSQRDDLRALAQWSFDAATVLGLDPVLVAVVGSHLTGYAHSGSDLDVLVVCNGSDRSAVVQRDSVDVHIEPLHEFTHSVTCGWHQSAEALFSPFTVMSEQWAPFLRSLRFDPYRFAASAERAVTVIGERDSVSAEKKARHAKVMHWYANQMLEQGRFDPSRAAAELG